MAKDPDRGSDLADLIEFGDHELAGAPSVAKLIAILPESLREQYRNERRAMVNLFCSNMRIPVCTYREYLTKSGT